MAASARPDVPSVLTVRAGFAVRDVTPALGVPLGGYGGIKRRTSVLNLWRSHPYARFFKPSTGILHPIRAKALVLEHKGRKLLFLSLDVVGIAAQCHRDLVADLAPLGFEPNGVLVCATHTHSGPGALSRDAIWAALVMDVFRPEVYRQFVAGAVEAVRQADASKQSATLWSVAFTARGLQTNRRHQADLYDPTANVLLAKSSGTGRWAGAMVNLAVHGTALPADNLAFSADVPGGIERALADRLGAPVLFVNGAEGDVAPAERGVEGIECIGRSFADQAMAALGAARPLEPVWSVRTRVVDLRKRSRGRLKAALAPWLPREAPLSVVRLGDMLLCAWPGEPTTRMGLAIKDLARQAGAAQAWTLGLTNGYVGYFVTPEEYRTGGYEAWASLYGPNLGADLIGEFASMLA